MSADEQATPAPTPTERFEARMQQSDPTYQLPVVKHAVLGREVTVRTGSAVVRSGAAAETGGPTTRAPVVGAPVDVAGWERAHANIADKDRWVARQSFNAKALSGYVLPDMIEGGTFYSPEVISNLAAARAAGITQRQLEAFLRNQAKADGYKLKGE